MYSDRDDSGLIQSGEVQTVFLCDEKYISMTLHKQCYRGGLESKDKRVAGWDKDDDDVREVNLRYD